jgi:hypothetical protein
MGRPHNRDFAQWSVVGLALLDSETRVLSAQAGRDLGITVRPVLARSCPLAKTAGVGCAYLRHATQSNLVRIPKQLGVDVIHLLGRARFDCRGESNG